MSYPLLVLLQLLVPFQEDRYLYVKIQTPITVSNKEIQPNQIPNL